LSHIQVVQEIGMTGMLRTGIGGRFIQYFCTVVFKKLCHFLKLLKTGMMHYGNYI